ncbi:NAC domain-containing protein 26-like [Cornus florida]|uniref:NAC domain-containing protein 26-like n=1 Tax=Cornus florida TaxID=4283 RepID=UPI002897DE7C|nr:NAC domain-containing protein 26-like [Cornus florida]
MEEIPIGYKLHPIDRELIQYLVCKAKEEALPCEDVVKDCDVYGKEPSKLFKGSEEKVLYFFTKLKKKHRNGSRIDRVTATIGTWKVQDKAKPIKDVDGTTGTSEEDDQETAASGQNYVICRIKRQKREEIKVMQAEECKVTVTPAPEDCNTMEPKLPTVLMQVEDCNTITDAMEPILLTSLRTNAS